MAVALPLLIAAPALGQEATPPAAAQTKQVAAGQPGASGPLLAVRMAPASVAAPSARAASAAALAKARGAVRRGAFAIAAELRLAPLLASRLLGGVPLQVVEEACVAKPTAIALDAASANGLGAREALMAGNASGGAGPAAAGAPPAVVLRDVHITCQPAGNASRGPAAVATYPSGKAQAAYVIDCAAAKADPSQPCLVAEVTAGARTSSAPRAAAAARASAALATCNSVDRACRPQNGSDDCGDYCACNCFDPSDESTCACASWHQEADDPEPDSGCHPASSTALRRAARGRVAAAARGAAPEAERVGIAALGLGDEVQVVLSDGRLGWSKVVVMPHADPDVRLAAYEITTASGHAIRATPDHYIYVAAGPGASWRDRAPVAARNVRAGEHWLWVLGDDGELAASAAVSTRVVAERGAFAAWTDAGTPVIDGVAPSPYAEVLGSEALVHAVRVGCSVLARALGATHPLACASWMHPGLAPYAKPIASVARAARRGWSAAARAAAAVADLRGGGLAAASGSSAAAL